MRVWQMIFTAFHLSYRKFKQTQGEYASGSLGFMLLAAILSMEKRLKFNF